MPSPPLVPGELLMSKNPMPRPEPFAHSLGVDIIEVERIRAAMRRWGDRFWTRHFTSAEIAYCRAKSRPAESLAARFAAKEAFAKACPGVHALRWRDVEVVMERGRPEYRLHGNAAGHEAQLSLSHTHDHAVAVALVRRREEFREPGTTGGSHREGKNFTHRRK